MNFNWKEILPCISFYTIIKLASVSYKILWKKITFLCKIIKLASVSYKILWKKITFFVKYLEKKIVANSCNPLFMTKFVSIF